MVLGPELPQPEIVQLKSCLPLASQPRAFTFKKVVCPCLVPRLSISNHALRTPRSQRQWIGVSVGKLQERLGLPEMLGPSMIRVGKDEGCIHLPFVK